MKKFIIGLMSLLISLPYATAQKNFLDVNYIEVTGTSEMEIEPDMIYLQIIINEKDLKKDIPINEQEKEMVSTLSKLGIDTKKDLSMEDLDSNFKKKKFGQSDILLSKRYILLVHDGATASKVYSSLEKINISNISVDKIDHSKIEDLRKQVKTNAIKAAKEKADYLTKSIGQNIGKALYIEEQNIFAEPIYRANTKMLAYASNSDNSYESDIDFKTINIKASMMVRFELK